MQKKKIIFIGNSYTYYGNCVVQKDKHVLEQEKRVGDQGYFYQLCKANGLDIDVTDFTFGNHHLLEFKGACLGHGHDGHDHMEALVDKKYDYVVLQEAHTITAADPDIVEKCSWMMDIFRQANPDVKFLFLLPWRAYEQNYAWLPTLKNLEDLGVTVVNWGKLVYDMFTGAVTVPGAKYTYNKNSFIVNKSAADGYHPNMLTGYITALMTYCAITGESAVGQPYAFTTDYTVNPAFNTDIYILNHYCYGDGMETNFVKILQSAEDMRGIQQLIDQYMEK